MERIKQYCLEVLAFMEYFQGNIEYLEDNCYQMDDEDKKKLDVLIENIQEVKTKMDISEKINGCSNDELRSCLANISLNLEYLKECCSMNNINEIKGIILNSEYMQYIIN